MKNIDARVLLIEGNQILLVLEKSKLITLPNGEKFIKPSKWGMPGGRSEAGDKDEIAVAEREVKHEIGIFPEVNDKIKVERQERDYLKVAFLGYSTSGTIKVDPEEIIEARWFDRKILYDDQFEMYTTQRRMAQELLKKLRK